MYHFSSPRFHRQGQLASNIDALLSLMRNNEFRPRRPELLTRGLHDRAISGSFELGEDFLSYAKSLWPSIQQVDGSYFVLSTFIYVHYTLFYTIIIYVARTDSKKHLGVKSKQKESAFAKYMSSSTQ